MEKSFKMPFAPERTFAIPGATPRFIVLLILTGALIGYALSSISSQPSERSSAVPILVYHRFGPVAVNDMTVTTARFQAQTRQLVHGGHTVIPLRRLVAYLLGARAAAMPGAIHPPSRHIQRTITELAKWTGIVSLARLERSQSDERDLTGGSRVHPPVPPARASQRLRENPTFRISVQPQPQKARPALPRTAPRSIGRSDCR